MYLRLIALLILFHRQLGTLLAPFLPRPRSFRDRNRMVLVAQTRRSCFPDEARIRAAPSARTGRRFSFCPFLSWPLSSPRCWQ
jgi:hypothetical protein